MAKKIDKHQCDLASLELECMRALWALGPATVHQVRAEIGSRRPLAYTTVMTVMGRLARKGAARRKKRGRSHIYRAAIAEHAVRSRAVEKLVRGFFDGSPEKLFEYLRDPWWTMVGGGKPAKSPVSPQQGLPRGTVDSGAEGIDASLL
jgi:predicted transcriptional regulator